MANVEDFRGHGHRPAELVGRVRASSDQDTELVVECLIKSARRNRDPTAAPEELVVPIARFGTALARHMAEQHEPLTRLRIQALVEGIEAEPNDQTSHPAITINVLAEGATVKRDDLHQVALVTIGERSFWPQVVRVELGAVEVDSRRVEVDITHAEVLAASAPSVTSAPPPNEVAEVLPPSLSPTEPRAAQTPVADERRQPAATGAAPPRRGVLPVVVVGVVLAAVAVGVLVTTTLAPRPQSLDVEFVTPEELGVAASQPSTAVRPAPTEPQRVESTTVPTAVRGIAAPTATEVLAASPRPTVVAPAAAPVVAAPVTAAPVLPPVVAVPSPSIATGPRTVFDAQFGRARPPGWHDDRPGVAWFDVDGYHLRAATPDKFVALAVPQTGPLENVLVALTYRKLAGPPGGGVGVILRDQESGRRDGLNQTGRFYVLELSDSGSVGIWRRDADAWVDIVPWTPTRPGLIGDRDTVLEAQAVGSQLQLRVNGEETIGASDSTLQVGGVGVFLGGDDNEAVLRQLRVQMSPGT